MFYFYNSLLLIVVGFYEEYFLLLFTYVFVRMVVLEVVGIVVGPTVACSVPYCSCN
jgi:hypothetical protein